MQTASSWNPAPDVPAGSSRPAPRTGQLIGVGVVAVVGAALAVLADGAPTMWDPADAVWRALFVAVAALAGSRARRWTLVAGAVIVVACGAGWSLAPGIVALLGSIGMLVLKFRDRVVGAVVGAGIALAGLALVRPDLAWAPAVAAAAAVLPMFVSGYRRSRRRTRRIVRRCLLIPVLLLVLAVGGVAAFGLDQRDAITAAVDETQRAVDLLAADDTAGAQEAFTRAAAQFGSIRDDADVPWLVPARLTPVIGPNLKMVRTAAAVGADLNVVADELSASLDQDALRAAEGGIDLTVLAGMQEPVARATGQIRAAQHAIEAADSPWLLRPVRSGIDELTTELDRTRATAELAELAVDRTPALLGAEGPRRYLMLLGNPAETRDIGGHIGNWAELQVVDGRFELTAVGAPYELASPATDPPLTFTSGEYPQSLAELRPQYHPQNWGGTPDFPSVAKLAAELFPQARPGAPIDGVVYADPSAFAALLTFTGPVAVPGTTLTLSPENAAEFLTTLQFTAFPTESAGNEAVSGLIEDVMRQFSTGRLPGPRQLADVLGPLVDEGRLQFESLHGADRPLLEGLGLRGQVERPAEGDLLSVVTRNTNPSKIDAYLRRQVEYRARWRPGDPTLRSTVRISLTNDAPATGLPAVVLNPNPAIGATTNRTTVSVLSPGNAVAATLDGVPVGTGTQQELPGIRRHSVLVDLPAGRTRVVELELESSIGTTTPYRLQWIGQPSVHPGEVEITVQQGTRPRSFRLDGAVDGLVTVRAPS